MTRSGHRPERNPAAQPSPAVVEVCYPFCRKQALAVRRREFITIIGGGGEDNLTRYDLTPVRGLGCWGWVLASPAEHVTGSVDCTSSVAAHDVHSKLLGQFC